MTLAAPALAAFLAALAVSDLADRSAGPVNPDQAVEALRQMIPPSPEAARAYATALEIWQRENGIAPAMPPREAPNK